MAHCTKCSRDVGCGCNLNNGLCAACYGENFVSTGTPLMQKHSVTRVVYSNPTAQPNTEFDNILNTKGLSKEEKLKRINDILEKARQEYANKS